MEKKGEVPRAKRGRPKDDEELYLLSQKDMNLLIENVRSETLNKGDDNRLIKK